jgi:hypothetical protein
LKTYQIKDHLEYPGRWFLQAPIDKEGRRIHPAEFLKGINLVLSEPVHIPLRRPGECLDFTFADYGMPVINQRIADFLKAICADEIQLFSASVDGSAQEHFILNILNLKDCMDMTHSVYDLWKEADNVPENVGKIFGVFDLKIDPNRFAGADICRIPDWKVPIVVSERIKVFLESNKFTGIFFEDV